MFPGDGTIAYEVRIPKGVDPNMFMELLKARVEKLTPIGKTGNLSSSWVVNGNVIENLMPYAQYVEEGNTRGMSGRRMLQRALRGML
jgi:hypothetical protein